MDLPEITHEHPADFDHMGRLRGEWNKIVRKYGLRNHPIEKVAPWWHVDIDFCRTIECVTDMGRSRKLGFLDYQNTWDAFVSLFQRLRTEKIIP